MKPRKRSHSLKWAACNDGVWQLMLQRWTVRPRMCPDLQRSAKRFRIGACAFRSNLLATR
jgi:hypothetical protein